jgi:hypothetical protein
MTRPLLIAFSAFAFGCAGKAETESSGASGGAASNKQGATSGAPGAGAGGGAPECKDVECPSFACPAGTDFVTLPGQCCPSCVTPADAGSGALPCPSVASYCEAIAHNRPLYSEWPQVPCVVDWTTAETTAAWCPSDAGASVYRVEIYPACGGYNSVVLGATDTSTSYLYDIASGQLVGIGGASLGGWACLAGVIPASDVSVGCDDDAGQPPTPLCGE